MPIDTEQRAGQLLAAHRDTLEALARDLVEKRSLGAKDIALVLERVKAPCIAKEAPTPASADHQTSG